MSIAATTEINLSILAGTLSRPPDARSLPSGSTVLELQLRVRPAAGPAESVPVSWPDPSPAARSWGAGQAVVVVGRVRRRFFRAGGATASRTEVVATTVLPASRRVAVAKALDAALSGLQATLAR